MSESDSRPRVECRDIPGCDGYFASSDGRIWSSKQSIYHDDKPDVLIRGQICHEMTYTPSRKGYRTVGLYIRGKLVRRRVCRLVLEAFVGVRPPGMECRHHNGRPSDDRLDNLSWGTPKQNMDDQYAHGTRVIGTRCHTAILNEEKVAEMRERYDSGIHSHRSLAELYGTSKSNVGALLNRKTWKHVA